MDLVYKTKDGMYLVHRGGVFDWTPMIDYATVFAPSTVLLKPMLAEAILDYDAHPVQVKVTRTIEELRSF